MSINSKTKFLTKLMIWIYTEYKSNFDAIGITVIYHSVKFKIRKK